MLSEALAKLTMEIVSCTITTYKVVLSAMILVVTMVNDVGELAFR